MRLHLKKLKFLRKQYRQIPARIRDGNINSGSIYFPTRGFFNIVIGRVLLISGDYHKLLGMAEQLIADSAVFPNLLGQIYVYIYVAAANQKLHRHEKALAAEGLSNKQIGEVLFISENTVKVALKSVFGKLSINNRALLEQALK